MKSFIKKFWIPIIIILTPIPSIFWLPKGEVLAHGLSVPWYSASIMFKYAVNFLFTWNSNIGLGSLNTEPSGFMYYFYTFLTTAIGGSSYLGQVLFFYLGFLGCIFNKTLHF